MTIEVKELSRTFHNPKKGEFFAVNKVSFSCDKGEVFGLLGPNGAGKTTTLQMISTLVKPTSGSVTVNGFDVVKEPIMVRKQIGFTSSDTGLYERLTPKEILRYFARLHKYPEKNLESRIELLATQLNMLDFIDTRAHKLSTGMKQKVSLARALIHDPPILILDEPTSGLDVITSQVVHEIVRACREEGKCIVFSTHIMNEAEKLCDRIGIIYNGILHAIGTLEELREKTGKQDLEEIFLAVVQNQMPNSNDDQGLGLPQGSVGAEN